MFVFEKMEFENKEKFYEYFLDLAKMLTTDENDMIANMANLSSLVWNTFDDINWAGFYINRNNQLVLGPFHGKPACIRIDFGRGVCGTAASTLETQVVKDVDAFPGHIACDSASKSEIVVPIVKNGELLGVLDIDSPIADRFDQEDAEYLELLVKIFQK